MHQLAAHLDGWLHQLVAPAAGAVAAGRVTARKHNPSRPAGFADTRGDGGQGPLFEEQRKRDLRQNHDWKVTELGT